MLRFQFMDIPTYLNAPAQPIDLADHRQIRARLPEYITGMVLGQIPSPAWQPLQEHLRRCPACRHEADRLHRLVAAIYTGELAPVADAPPPRQSFLPPPPNSRPDQVVPSPDRPPPRPVRAPASLVLPLSAALLAQLYLRMSARFGGIHTRSERNSAPRRAHGPTVKIAILALPDQTAYGQVRICVAHPERHPSDQAGTMVRLLAGDRIFGGRTNASGEIVFSQVPLDEIASWEIDL